ncbi:Grx4 family monothiol glutaredoxin [Candidatus Comchoanobacter bicostacola]|uniref:Glutaredoxin n=1 Tax=Candidatus Comchoanobacter bicostacola TaxID=2919598 RepID=A0ABY5DLL1_9GAMM|nr:Grx4 family monothiol glutaredoxin [Candidatus Comchoanobacter bicostacola]UTC24671.1 Grx4 family monothiol glutaredoxin [Candidatus Comchoanobacter bicostacola]
MSEINQKIEALIKANKVVLFMKGTPDAPQCGYSAHAVAILRAHKCDFFGVDILAYPDLRSGLKIYSDWPTFPQLYVNAEFQGGVDIMLEMHQEQSLSAVLSATISS